MMFAAILLTATLIAAPHDVVPTSEVQPFATRIAKASARLPRCLSRFVDYPPGPGKLGFPRSLFENPFPPNPDFWLKGIDFTCASPWNDSHGRLRAGTAISKRHILMAAHFPLQTGARIAFVGENGDVSHYSVKGIRISPKCDIAVGLLDYELTPDVHPAKILPSDYEKWMPAGSKWPVVTLNQFEQGVLTEVHVRTNGVPLMNDVPADVTAKKWVFAVL